MPRLRIRALLALVAATGLFLAFVRSLAPVLVRPAGLATHTMVAWVFCLVLGYGLSQAIGWNARTAQWRVNLTIALVVAVVASGYLAWAFYRCDGYSSAIDEEGFPYPDRMINGSERWLDAQRPPSPESHGLKLHGEYPLVSLVLAASVAALLATIGLILGTLLGAGPRFSRAAPGANSAPGPSSEAKRDG